MKQEVVPASKASAALLKISELNLLLPQSDIRTLEAASDIDATAPALNSAGWITYHQKRWPVYCLSDDLAIMQKVPPERRACAMLTMGAGYMGVLCDDMAVLKDFSAQRFELPVAMKFPDTPILHIAYYEQGIGCVSNAKQLTMFIEQLVLRS